MIDPAIAAQRARTRAEQEALIQQRRSPDRYRVGARDATTGKHHLVYPDGSVTNRGVKVSDANIEGQSVWGCLLPSGAIAAIGPKGVESPIAPLAADTGGNRPQVRNPATPLKDNCVGYHYGQLFPCPEPEVADRGNIKYLYSLLQEGQRNFYVGGWQEQPVKVLSLPVTTQIVHASVDNLGGDRWSLNLALREGEAATLIQKFDHQQAVEWSAETNLEFVGCYGHGFWEFRGPNVMISPPEDELFVESYMDYQYFFKGNTGFSRLSAVSVLGGVDSDPGHLPNPEMEITSYEENFKAMQIPVDADLSGLFLPNLATSIFLGRYYWNGAVGTVNGAASLQNVRRKFQPIKIDLTGRFGIGKRTDSQASETMTSVGFNVHTQRSHSTIDRWLWYSNRQMRESRATLSGSLLFDCHGKTGFSAIANDPPLFPALPAPDRSVQVTLFSPGFKRLRKFKIKTFKPSGEGTYYHFHNASYA